MYGADMHVMGRRIRTFAGFAVASAVGLVWLAPGCKKEKESLILVDMQATTRTRPPSLT